MCPSIILLFHSAVNSKFQDTNHFNWQIGKLKCFFFSNMDQPTIGCMVVSSNIETV